MVGRCGFSGRHKCRCIDRRVSSMCAWAVTYCEWVFVFFCIGQYQLFHKSSLTK